MCGAGFGGVDSWLKWSKIYVGKIMYETEERFTQMLKMKKYIIKFLKYYFF